MPTKNDTTIQLVMPPVIAAAWWTTPTCDRNSLSMNIISMSNIVEKNIGTASGSSSRMPPGPSKCFLRMDRYNWFIIILYYSGRFMFFHNMNVHANHHFTTTASCTMEGIGSHPFP